MGLLDKLSGQPKNTHAHGASSSAQALKLALRKLWSDHVIWTREYIVAAVAGTPDASAAATRLLRNQEDIGSAIVPYYGRAAADKLTSLLKEHITIAVKLVDAAKSGNNAEFGVQDREWTRNADDIAAFLSGANPHWPRADVQSLLHLHLKLTKDEAVARLQKNYDADVKAFDDIFAEAMTISDALADGLVANFPEKFQA